MSRCKHDLSALFVYGVIAFCIVFGLFAPTAMAQSASVPQYDHVFLVIMENNGYGQIVGNPYAPVLNALAKDYGVATKYTGVADPSEPNYVAMLGGDFFGITSDDPYFFPGQTVDAENLLSQLNGVGKTWKGYFKICLIPVIAATAIRTSATAFPMPTLNTSPSTTAW
jgi:hypothetical protein